MNIKNKYFEFLRLAFVAGSQASESILNDVEFSNKELEMVDGYIEIDRCYKLIKFFKDNGQIFDSDDGRRFVLDHCFITKPTRQNHVELRFKYSYFERPERLIIEKALEAIHYVLVQLEPNIEIVIKNK